MKKAVIILSGGLDSACMMSYLKKGYQLYGITFAYGQRASEEIKAAKRIAKLLKLKEHKILDIGFMKELYGDSNVLTNTKKKMPSKFEYSIVVPIRNAIFLSIATAWAFTLNAELVAYGVTISGAGPSVIAFTDKKHDSKKISNAMKRGFKTAKKESKVFVCKPSKGPVIRR